MSERLWLCSDLIVREEVKTNEGDVPEVARDAGRMGLSSSRLSFGGGGDFRRDLGGLDEVELEDGGGELSVVGGEMNVGELEHAVEDDVDIRINNEHGACRRSSQERPEATQAERTLLDASRFGCTLVHFGVQCGASNGVRFGPILGPKRTTSPRDFIKNSK